MTYTTRDYFLSSGVGAPDHEQGNSTAGVDGHVVAFSVHGSKARFGNFFDQYIA